MTTRFCFAAVLALLLFTAPAPAATVTWGFHNITGNEATDAAFGEAQLFVDITDEGLEDDEGVGFIFRNTGPEASVISEIYFDDGTLLALARIANSPLDVVFVEGAVPQDLPGGENLTPPFVATAAFSAEADDPAPHRGVGPGQEVGLFFTLQASQTFNDVLAALNAGALRIGIHVIAFDGGGSESFVAVPEPGFYGLMSLMLGGLFLARRKFVFARN